MSDQTGTDNLEWTFVVAKTSDGRIAVGNLDGSNAAREPTVDDIYQATALIQRDLQVNQTISGLAQMLAQANGGNAAPSQTKSGIVVPEPSSKFKKIVRQP